MSRRYGRNQKRRHRAEIADAERRLNEQGVRDGWVMADQHEKIEKLTADIGHLRYALELAKEVLGEDNPAFTPREIESLREMGLSFHHRVRKAAPVCITSMSATSVREDWQRIDLVTADAQRDNFRKQMHFRVNLGDGRLAYGLSVEATDRVPASVLAARIAPELSQMLAQAIEKERSA